MQPTEADPTQRIMAPHAAHDATPLHEIPGASIDRSSLIVGNGGVLVHYISNNVDFATATQATIIIHGVDRNASDAYIGVQGAAQAAGKSNVILMAVRTPFLILKKWSSSINAYSLFSSMDSIRACSHGKMAKQLPINSCGKVGTRANVVQN